MHYINIKHWNKSNDIKFVSFIKQTLFVFMSSIIRKYNIKRLIKIVFNNFKGLDGQVKPEPIFDQMFLIQL